MAYNLDGTNGEEFGFTKAIAGFALRAMHESSGLVDVTSVVQPNQGNQFLVPNFAPITYQDYAPNAAPATGGFGAGGAVEQNPALTQREITATPAVAATAFDVFYAWTTSFELAATLGQELGESYAEKVDQRVCGAFLDFKADIGDTNYSTPADGFDRPVELGAVELIEEGETPVDASATSASVLGLVRIIKTKYKKARLPGSPTVVLDVDQMERMLSELTGGAVSQSGGANLSMLGNELLETGKIESVYGCRVMFSTFLPTANRAVNGAAADDIKVGAYFHDSALYTVLKEGLQIKMGEKPGGLQQWLTGLAYMGAGVGDRRRGGAINIA